MLTILSLVAAINALLTWIGRGVGIHQLTLQLVIGYLFYPITFFLGVPRSEILPVSQLLATKLVANEFAAYLGKPSAEPALSSLLILRTHHLELQAIMNGPQPLSPRAHTISTYALCGFANLAALGIQIGVLSALAPSRRRVIARIATSAMLCGFLSTLQTAGIAYVIACPLRPFPNLIDCFVWSSGMLV